jgi:RNA polymerase sigma-B factor
MTSTATPSPTSDRPGGVASRARRGRGERALFARVARDGDPTAREALVAGYMPLARSMAMRYQRSTEPLDDLMQVASLGLVKAIDGFDAGRGIAFSSYAVPTILGEIKRHFRDRTWSVRVPRGLQELSARVDRAVGELTEDLHRQPSVQEIAAHIGTEEEEVLEALHAGNAYRLVSLETPRGAAGRDEDVSTLGDAIGVEEIGFHRAEQRATIDMLLAVITPREREALRLRFEEDLTQAEIGEIIGVSQMQVSRIIHRALTRLRDAGAGR